jgi:hypothetical protein
MQAISLMKVLGRSHAVLRKSNVHCKAASVSVSRPLTYLGFAFWVSVCAAAPEFIWQGLVLLTGHFTRQNVYAIFLLGLILTVFVEPILERAKEGKWRPEHGHARSLLLTAPLAFVFGLVAVGLHECMTAFLAADGHEPAIGRGVSLILEWAWIPLAVNLAWFSARYEGFVRYLVGALALLWIVGIGWLYNWPARDIVMTLLPCLVLIPLGQRFVARDWNDNTFLHLAWAMAGFIAVWLAATLGLQAVLTKAGVTGFQCYQPGDLGSDLRFFLGWAIGLVIAPSPAPWPVRNRQHENASIAG